MSYTKGLVSIGKYHITEDILIIQDKLAQVKQREILFNIFITSTKNEDFLKD